MSKGKLHSWFRILQWGIALGAIAYVSWRLYQDREGLAAAWQAFLDHPGWLLLALAGVFPNLWLESEKWRLIVRRIYPNTGRRQAFLAVLAGMASGIFTPNRIGEYAGRIMYLRTGKRVEAVFATFYDRICQLAVTLLVGAVALAWIPTDQPIFDPAFDRAVAWLAGISTVLVLCFLVWPQLPARLVPVRFREREGHWLQQLYDAPQHLDRNLLIRVFALSALRYLVFSLQFALLLLAFGLTRDWGQALFLISLFFLLKSLVPVLGVMELGLRETVALQVFGWAGMGASGIVSATFLLYLINIVLPTLAGVYAIWALDRRKEVEA